MKLLLSFFVLFLIEQVVSKSDRVKLEDVQVLTLQKGKYTEARRSRRIHQLKCVGGTARCSFIPETVQCYNRGWDGRTVNWECKADMDKKYSFGLLEVNCEGYEHPDDDYILAGSCGLEFTINVADGAPRQRSFNLPPYPKSMTPYDSKLGSQSIVIIIFVIGGLFFIIHIFYEHLFLSSRNVHEPTAPPPAPGPSPRNVHKPTAPPPPPAPGPSPRKVHKPTAPPPAPGFRPDYFGNPPPYYHGSVPWCGPRDDTGDDTGDGPGFGTGFVAAGLLGYLFARNLAKPSYTRENFSSSTHQNNSNFGKTYASTETETETKVGYATTKRR